MIPLRAPARPLGRLEAGRLSAPPTGRGRRNVAPVYPSDPSNPRSSFGSSSLQDCFASVVRASFVHV
ncbi:hypothetical protein GCM10018783_64140 [Streptomyces griseosporeus]|nr:hypothetical protein GCM10018783_64140 [Streptomyces griseosporeus]